ncbi:hypothetical protein G7Y89_g6464 [Cudoniella acicularis]|uniref:Uncharacterized protein n=1 Tax=Cudoniella acicularis TaxID=354080 RepID=A0A8H4W4R0_9HELO|nr:hypothetical protein G7Y89_g6464 [Cudoniella acicularis]
MNDLAPYICLDPACTTPRVRYRSFKQWVFHMNEHISLEWICYSDNHPEHTFSDVEKYKNHIKKDHDSEIGASQLAALAQAHARPAAPIFKVCPFCDEIPKDLATPDIGEDKLGIYKNLLKHVGKHLQSLALLSLTWLGNRPDLDGDAGENSATDPILPEPIFSELPSSVGISQEMGFDPDWKGIHPYVPDLGDDPAWLLWLSENSGNIHSRETEWLLAEGERVLNLYSKTGPDPMMLEFQLQFRVLTPSQREHHVLIPADEFPAQDTTSKPDITLPKRTDSDDGANENVRVRLMETSERVVSIVESLTVKTDNLASETQQPLREAHGIGYGGEENNRAQESPQLVRRFSDEPLHGSVAYEETSDRFVIDKINYHDTVESINLSMIYNPALELSNQLSKDIEKFLKTAPPKFTIAILPLGNNIPESVVESLETIEKMGEHVSKSAGLLKDLRKSFRNFGRHRKVLMGLGEIVPGGDRFLGIMCGCLKLILRVLSIHKKLADPTLRMLCEIGHAISIDAYIPVTMKWSESVHKAFSRLWVSIFSGLQCILEYYSKNTILRFAKVFASPANMDKMLGEKTSMIIDCKVGLERELQLAVSESTQQASVRFSHNVQELSDVLPSLQPHNKQQIRVDLVPHQETQAANERALIWAALQKMIADSLVVADSYKSADPSYHKQTTVRNDEFIASKFPLSSFKYLDGDARLTSKALSCLSYQTEFDLPRRDIRTNRKFASGFLQDDRDRSAYVLDSRQLFHWLHPDTSSILVINAGLASTQRRSLGGFICADICHSLRKMKVEKPIILNFFCGEHRDSSEDPDANPAGIINSMLSQLLQQYDRFDPALLRRFTFLDNEDVTQLCAKLSQLIRSLPPPLVVFCVIDRLFLYDDERRGADAAELLRRLVKLSKPRQGRGDHCRFKVLLTGSGRWIAKAVTEGLARDCVLTIPDRVPSSPVTWLCQSRKAFGDFGTA